jgi:hypothetical protein
MEFKIIEKITEYFNSEDKEKKELKENIKKLSTQEIRDKLKLNEKESKYLNKEFEKRNDKTRGELFSELFSNWIYAGGLILLLGLFYLGALPVYFGVNNEFLNPSNSSMGLNSSMIKVTDAGNKVIIEFMNSGAENPTFWFWFWWISVFILFIYPLVSLIIKLIRRKYGRLNKYKTISK